MEATSIKQLLKSICDDTHWAYAVFWKLNPHSPMILTLEDGYCGYQKPNGGVESTWIEGDIKFNSPDEEFSSSFERIGGSGAYSVQLLMTQMSHLKYNLGEGVVGKVALTGDHCWALCEDIFTSNISTNLIPECPYEWRLQFASCIKTILLVPVLPQGVLQFGSFEAVAEDLAYVANIKEKFSSIHCMAANTKPLSSDINILSWSFSAPTDCLMDNVDDLSSISNNILQGELGSISLNINESTRFNLGMPSSNQDECWMSGEDQPISLKRTNENEVISPLTGKSNDPRHIGQVETKSNHKEKKIWACSQKINNLGAFGETPNEICSYVGKDAAEQQFGGTDSDYKGCKNLNSFFSFPLDSELHKARVPGANRHAVDDTYSSSTLISNKKDHDHDLEFPKEEEAEYLSDAVDISCSVSDDASYILNNVMSPTNLPIELIAAVSPQSHFVGSTLMADNSDLESHITPAFVNEGKDDFTNRLTSTSFHGNSSILINETQQEKIYSHVRPSNTPKLSSTSKKRARVCNSQRPRPRDRQLIMDRMKELRELVPDTARCSIDNLLDRTIKHMLYLRRITNEAEKLKECVHQEVSKCKKQKINNSHTGRSCAFDIESEFQVCPIVIEDLKCSGHMLIEMRCSEPGLFLEIAQVIRQMELAILKGVLETRSGTILARFIVKVPRGFHRMDILCPLLHLLQLRRNPVSNRI